MIIMNNKFYEKKDYEWEYEYPFGEDFLKSVFKEDYKRVYSRGGEGIFNIVTLNNKYYSIDLKSAKSMLANDGKKAFRDETKDIVITSIADGLNKLNIEYTINSGKFITFKMFDSIFKIEVVKKAAMP